MAEQTDIQLTAEQMMMLFRAMNAALLRVAMEADMSDTDHDILLGASAVISRTMRVISDLSVGEWAEHTADYLQAMKV